MKIIKIINPLIIVVCLILCLPLFITAQSVNKNCPTANTILATQLEVDGFIAEYGTCDSLFISLEIVGSEEKLDLSLLNFIKYIAGDLLIGHNDTIISLQGFERLTKIGGNLMIQHNDSLVGLEGFERLTEIGGNLMVEHNDNLVSLEGFERLTEISGNLVVQHNGSLVNFEGLNALVNVGEALLIMDNNALQSLNGLDALDTVGTTLSIENNATLENIAPLTTIKSIGEEMTVIHNANLSDCSVLCTFREGNITNSIRVINNAYGCISLEEVTNFCNGGACPKGFHYLTSQKDIERFSAVYNGCDSLIGELYISGYYTITDLSPLSFLTYISGNLTIRGNRGLASLEGLNNLTTIGGSFFLEDNQQLANLEALSTLKNIGRDFKIVEADSLKRLDGLEGLQMVGRHLDISLNPSLMSIEALNQLAVIGGELFVRRNPQLGECDIICSWLDNEVVTYAFIEQNNFGCSTMEEFNSFCQGKNCPIGDFYLSSQQEIADFAKVYGACDSLIGKLTISNKSSTTTDLSELSFLQYISGDLIIDNNHGLTSLEGLNQLESIGGSLTIYGNSTLSSMKALTNLDSIGGNLSIENTKNLRALEGLEGLKVINGTLTIRENDNLETINALGQVNINGFWISIENNPNLANCSILCNFIEGIDSFSIHNNKADCKNILAVQASCTENKCPSGDYVLSSQSDVAIFAAAFNHCDTLFGNLNILNTANNITDLSPLSFLTYLSGNLSISNNETLKNLEGLNNLSTVGGELAISYVTNLNSLAALASLDSIGKDFTIFRTDSLKSLNGLEQLSAIGGSFKIQFNLFLQNIVAIEQITSIGNNLTIVGNVNLGDCSSICRLIDGERVASFIYLSNNNFGCSNLEEVTSFCGGKNCPSGDFTINSQTDLDNFANAFNQCDSLFGSLIINSPFFNADATITDLTSLSFLTYIMGDLIITQNTSLTSLDGLQQLATIEGDLIISNNAVLTTINSLSSLDNVGGVIEISYNEVLSECAILCNIMDKTDRLDIRGNQLGCNNLPVLQLSCFEGNCVEGDIVLNSPYDVTLFASKFNACDSIMGNLTIGQYGDIQDLSPLSFLNYISGDLTIANNDKLTTLIGLDSLSGIGGDVYIHHNSFLTSLEGLQRIQTIEGNLIIQSNERLVNIDAIAAIQAIGKSLSIIANTILENCEAVCTLKNLNIVTNFIQIIGFQTGCLSLEEVTNDCQAQALPAIFTTHNWLEMYLNPLDCSTERMTVYREGIHRYINVETPSSTILYTDTGNSLCTSGPGYDCPSLYGLTEIETVWACNTSRLTPTNSPIFSKFKEPEMDFKVFPNPAKEQFTIMLPELKEQSFVLQINDLQGCMIQQVRVVDRTNTPIVINMSGQAAGVYLIRLTTNKGVKLRRVILN